MSGNNVAACVRVPKVDIQWSWTKVVEGVWPLVQNVSAVLTDWLRVPGT